MEGNEIPELEQCIPRDRDECCLTEEKKMADKASEFGPPKSIVVTKSELGSSSDGRLASEIAKSRGGLPGSSGGYIML